VIPLIEDREHLLGADRIVGEYLLDKDVAWQRVFLARSDPALNYGHIGAVLLLKIALYRLSRLERRLDVPLYPILGAGSAPFRGNLRPARVAETLREYPSVQTFTVQSAFKYDHAGEEARAGIARINESRRGEASAVDETHCRELADKVSARYGECVEAVAPLVNRVAAYVLLRRARRLHIGLYGYSRQLEGRTGIHLPRAIGFCAALYSIGLPPEILGLGTLTASDLATTRQAYATLDQDMEDSLRFLCEPNLLHLPAIVREDVRVARERFACVPHRGHEEIAKRILSDLRGTGSPDAVAEGILEAGKYRRFLG